MESARDLYKRGKELRDKGDLDGALEKMKAAYALAGTPILGLELGKTHLARKELVEARDAFLSVGRIPVKSTESANTKSARAESAKLADQLKARIPTLLVKVTGAPPEAVTLTIDGVVIPSAALGEPRKVNPGKHVAVASAGAASVRAEIELAEAEEKSITLQVEAPLAPAPTPAPTVASKPTGPTPSAPTGDEPPAPATTRTIGATTWLGLGLLGGGLLVGGVTGGVAWSKASSAKKLCAGDACPPSVHDDIDTGRTMGTISTVSFVVAGVGGLVTAMSLLLVDRPSNKTGSVRPLIGLGTVGLGGEF